LDGYILGSDGKRCYYGESRSKVTHTVSAVYSVPLPTVPELLLSTSQAGLNRGRVYVSESDGTELERNVDSGHSVLDINTGIIYAMEYNLGAGKMYFSDRGDSSFWMASLDNEIVRADDREVK